MSVRARTALLFGALLPGCASTSANPAWDDAAALVAARTMGHTVVWNRGGEEDAAVAKAVSSLVSNELGVDAAVQIALLNNKSLQATYEDLSVAQADVVQAGLLSNPVFGGSLAFPVAGAAQTGGSVSVSEDFLGVFLIAARKKIASAHLRGAKLRVADAVLRLAREVQGAFYALVAARQIAAMRRAVLEAGDAAAALARSQYEAGNASDLDLANQESLAEQARTDLVRDEALVSSARERLTRLLGLWGPETSSYRVAEKLPEMPEAEVGLDRLESLAVGRRLDLLAAREDVRAIAHAAALTKSTRWIGVASVGAGYERAPEGFSVAGPSAGLELPVFDQKQAVVARLEAELRSSLDREAALAIDIRSEVRASRSRLVATRAVVDRYEKVVVPLRRRIVALTQEQYGAMLASTFQLLAAKQSEVVAYRELIESLRDYWVARADLEHATGGALSPTSSASSAQEGAVR